MKVGSIIRIKDPLPKNITFINKSFEISGDWCDFLVTEINNDMITLQMTDEMTTRNGKPSDMIFKINRNDLKDRIIKTWFGNWIKGLTIKRWF